MTTPQSGREAFEAWAEREFGKVPESLPATERFASYWKCWQAALAQQGREVTELIAAVEQYRRDYSDNGCPDKDCFVCKRIAAAERRLDEALAAIPGKTEVDRHG